MYPFGAPRVGAPRRLEMSHVLLLLAHALLGPLARGSVEVWSVVPRRSRPLVALLELEPALGYFLAGGGCAEVSHGLACPIDVVKTRQQTVPEYRDATLAGGLARIVQDEGPAALLTGLVPTMVGYGVEGALKFGSYELVKAPLASVLDGLGPEVSGAVGPLMAGIFAGGLAALVVGPAEATRIRMVSDPSFSGDDMLGAARRLVQLEGSAGLLRGIPATISKQLPYTATKQVTFDALLHLAANEAVSMPRWTTTAAAALTAAVLSTLASQPGDAILSEVNCRAGPQGEVCDIETSDDLVAIVRRLGPGGLARGLSKRLVQVLSLIHI